jgi:NAD(P)-dependent dehydrogenase (short-subunit alcohol dehydrogenase family)
VFIRWTYPDVPPAKILGLNDLVISWNDAALSLLESGHKQGYHVYLEATPQQASAAAEAGKNFAAGVLLKVSPSEQTDVDATLQTLRSLHPKLTFLVLNPGKQPQMRGTLVLDKNGILEVSSPTAQPWLDTNLALVRIERAFRPSQVPLYSFQWELIDSLQKLQGPNVEDYLLAVAEAGAFHADLVLSLHENSQKALAQNDPDGINLWKQMRSYLEFYSRRIPSVEPEANIGVLAGDYKKSYERINLLARHNIPFRILRRSEQTAVRLKELDMLVVLASATQQNVKLITDFAARGGIAILVDLSGSYPWQSAKRVQTGDHWVAYAVGKGRIIELTEALPDPETFAQDIRRLMDKQKVLISLWNALTTVAVPYREPHAGVTTLELVNYAEEPLRVQVQIKGSFHSIRYQTPERGCCESLAPVQRNGFTEFVIPDLRIGGRVHLKEARAGERHTPASAK